MIDLFSMLMGNYDKKWCLYYHSVYGADLTQPPTLIYVGVCKLSQVFSFPDARQNSEWCKLVKPETTLIVDIQKFADERRPLDLERYKLRTTIKPHCNVRGVDVTVGNFPIKCLDDGRIFHTQQECADNYGFRQSQLSAHLNGRPGHRTVQGKMFIRMVE